MPDVTGYVSVRNKCGTKIENIRLSVTVGGTLSPLIQLNVLSDQMTSMNKRFDFPSGASPDWAISFTLKGTQMDGKANCKLTTADNNQMLKITVYGDEFTLAPSVSESVTGRYGDQV